MFDIVKKISYFKYCGLKLLFIGNVKIDFEKVFIDVNFIS